MTKPIKNQAKKPRFVVQAENQVVNPANMDAAQTEILKLKDAGEKHIVFIDHKTKLKITYELDRKNYRVKQEVYTPEPIPESIETDSNTGGDGGNV